MDTIKTTFVLTESAQQFQNLLIKRMDIPKTTFHRRMIDFFLKSDREIHPFLLIKRKADPNYIEKNAIEQIYIEEERAEKLKEIAKSHNCRMGIVLFQALLTYSVAVAPEVFGKDEMDELFLEEK